MLEFTWATVQLLLNMMISKTGSKFTARESCLIDHSQFDNLEELLLQTPLLKSVVQTSKLTALAAIKREEVKFSAFRGRV